MELPPLERCHHCQARVEWTEGAGGRGLGGRAQLQEASDGDGSGVAVGRMRRVVLGRGAKLTLLASLSSRMRPARVPYMSLIIMALERTRPRPDAAGAKATAALIPSARMQSTARIVFVTLAIVRRNPPEIWVGDTYAYFRVSKRDIGSYTPYN